MLSGHKDPSGPGFFLFLLHCLCGLDRFPAEYLLRIHQKLSALIGLFICSICLQDMGTDIVLQLHLQNMECLFLIGLHLHREHQLYPAVQVSGHPVSTAHIDFVIAAVLEIKDPAVLQKGSYNGAHLNIFTDSGNSGL